jgi:hypothetical protein
MWGLKSPLRSCTLALQDILPEGCCYLKIHTESRCWWLTPVIIATQEAEIRRIEVRSQPRQIVP